MPEHYGDSPAPQTNLPAPAKKGGLTVKQREDLKKHMDKLKKGGLSGTELKSHRMKMIVRMRKGMSVSAAHKDIGGK